MIAVPLNNSIPPKVEGSRGVKDSGEVGGGGVWKVNLAGETRLAVSSGVLTLVIIPIA